MERSKGQDLPNKYKRMLRIWDQRFGGNENRAAQIAAQAVNFSKEQFPPQRWCRDDRVKEVMEGRWGQRYRDYRELFRRSGAKEVVPEWPVHIDFDVADSCNLACPNCSENFREWTRATLDLDWIRNDPFFAKKKLLAANVGNACEPFLRPDLALELVRFLRANDIIDIFMHTNAILLDQDIIDQLIQAEVTWMSISVDAFSDETYQLTRGKGYQKVEDNIHLLLKRRAALGSDLPFVRLSLLVLPENYHEMRSFYDYWKQYVDMIEFQNYWVPNPVGVGTRPYVAETGLYEHLREYQCGMPWYRMSINPGGLVGPCCISYGTLPELQLGSVANQSIEEMWNSRKMQLIRQEHLNPQGPQGLKTCAQCLGQNYGFKFYGEGSDGEKTTSSSAAANSAG